jgi:hypothetical protein
MAGQLLVQPDGQIVLVNRIIDTHISGPSHMLTAAAVLVDLIPWPEGGQSTLVLQHDKPGWAAAGFCQPSVPLPPALVWCQHGCDPDGPTWPPTHPQWGRSHGYPCAGWPDDPDRCHHLARVRDTLGLGPDDPLPGGEDVDDGWTGDAPDWEVRP